MLTRRTCWRDPTSAFYDDERAHQPAYSQHRIQQAHEYAQQIGASYQQDGNRPTEKTGTPELCVGIPSVRRKGVSYLSSTLGSLQQGLSPAELSGLRFVVLLAYTNQSAHPDHGQPWLSAMADRLVSYGDRAEWAEAAAAMERHSTHETKSKLDYSIVMQACHETGAPYTLMLEDDVVFLDGWRHRAIDALARAADASSPRGDFLYLRLFWHEGLRGWHREAWRTYLAWSAATPLAACLVMALARRHAPSRLRRHITPGVVLVVSAAVPPFLVGLYFLAGGNCVQPQPRGVHLMPRNACCGQALAFPRHTVEHVLLPHFAANRASQSPTDSFIEDYAEATGALRFGVTPVLAQHVGGQSSYGGDHSLRNATNTPDEIWSFDFETNDPDMLAAEHARVLALTDG